ncbi:hypothetical protein [Marinoscillum sp.]|uniref:hypothetical protein n=1 Tax=Marinoscillum sp. TaxID=2024838 RepID=UPI003BAD339B
MQKLGCKSIGWTMMLCLYFTISMSGCSESRKVYLPRDLELLTVSDSTYTTDPFACSCKVVAYFKVTKYDLYISKYIPYMKQYPNVSFIFYLSGDGKEQMQEIMQTTEFKHPVFLDPEKSYIKVNKRLQQPPGQSELAFIGYVISDKFIEVTNPNMNDFSKLIKRCAD